MVMLALRSYSYYTLLYLHYLYRTVPTLPWRVHPRMDAPEGEGVVVGSSGIVW